MSETGRKDDRFSSDYWGQEKASQILKLPKFLFSFFKHGRVFPVFFSPPSSSNLFLANTQHSSYSLAMVIHSFSPWGSRLIARKQLLALSALLQQKMSHSQRGQTQIKTLKE